MVLKVVIYYGDSEILHLKAVLKSSKMFHLKTLISTLKAVISIKGGDIHQKPLF